ncbi:MAG: sugar ABC transporter substrate-binding protein [Phycisphaerae bacterium]|nr:sugar ABC transporter substrate-binding protein [Phycisphaerae bacterium]
MTRRQTTPTSRREFLKRASLGTGLGLGVLAAGCDSKKQAKAPGGKTKRLRAAFSNGGLTTTFCKMGHDAAKLWGDLLDVQIVWVDGELNPQKQREKLELIVDQDLDFCCFQALQTGALVEPVKQLAKRGIPVISMDTLIAEKPKLRESGVWTLIAGDHTKMAEQSVGYLMEKIGGRGKIIHIGGASSHSGAQDRLRGFKRILAKYPQVQVVGGGVRWCDWKTELARNTFELLLQKSDEPIAGAFIHNDDMALACVPALKGTPHEKMIITAVDGQPDGLEGVRDGRLAATTVNPTSMIHMMSLVVGQFIVRNGEKREDVPVEIPLPCPLVSREAGNLNAMFYLSDAKHCLV